MTPVRLRAVIAALGISLFATASILVQPADCGWPKISVAVGQSVTQHLPARIKTVSIADTKVADVVVAGPEEILINGKAAGFTTLVVWSEDNESYVYNVVVRGAFSDQQIELRVQVAEVNRTKANELGFDFLLRDLDGKGTDGDAGSYGGGVAAPQMPLQIFQGTPSEGTSLALRYLDTVKNIEVQTMIHALEEKGALKILAKPNVVAASGQSADFLAGGEIPIPISSTGSGGAATITIEYKEFGVKVAFNPTIVDSGVISLKVAPEVSNLNYGNGVVIGGFIIPGLDVRKAETTVELEDGQVLIIGGLLREEENNIDRKIPILGHIPLLGVLFSHTEKQTTTQELLLVVSPHIIRALPKGTEVALPGATKEEG